jgi:energy-coupling factor transporter ATP-binding protein EcfA2
MYLKEVYIEHNGPIERILLTLQFYDDLKPKPTILVGPNGSGKSNFVSIIADALFEAAAVHFHNVTSSSPSVFRPYFRLVGQSVIAHGAPGSVSLLNFEHKGSQFFFKEKAGIVAAEDAAARLPPSLQHLANWPENESIKEFSLPDDVSRQIFEQGVHIYFPTSRSEVPFWLNRESVQNETIDLSQKLSKRLRKPIFVERGLEDLVRWILGLLIDVRIDIDVLLTAQTKEMALVL